jgi:hypothetical protein
MPRASSIPVASVPQEDSQRVQHLEQIVKHFLGDVPLDEENLSQITDKLQAQATSSAQPEGPLNVNESFDVHFVSSNVAHYSGEFSHWNFSQKIRRKMNCHIDQQESRVGSTFKVWCINLTQYRLKNTGVLHSFNHLLMS